jgi:hypothetical protein
VISGTIKDYFQENTGIYPVENRNISCRIQEYFLEKTGISWIIYEFFPGNTRIFPGNTGIQYCSP